MKETVVELYRFQLTYLEKLVENISDELLYRKQDEGFNSLGWILGHLIVEAEDVFHDLEIPNEVNPKWSAYFKNSSGKIDSDSILPSKEELIDLVKSRYNRLAEEYSKLTDLERTANHPSSFLREKYSSYDAWFAHHITTHIAIHCGNIVVWKKMMSLEINGY